MSAGTFEGIFFVPKNLKNQLLYFLKKSRAAINLRSHEIFLIAISVMGSVMLMGLFSLRNGVFLVIAVK